jgi:hypothetical protein
MKLLDQIKPRDRKSQARDLLGLSTRLDLFNGGSTRRKFDFWLLLDADS